MWVGGSGNNAKWPTLLHACETVFVIDLFVVGQMYDTQRKICLWFDVRFHRPECSDNQVYPSSVAGSECCGERCHDSCGSHLQWPFAGVES